MKNVRGVPCTDKDCKFSHKPDDLVAALRYQLGDISSALCGFATPLKHMAMLSPDVLEDDEMA
jgi:hypothetical protein